MHRLPHVAFAALAATSFSAAQDPQIYFCNSNTVRSTAAHATTGQYYPYGPTCPPAYTATGPGVTAGTRLWQYTPKFRCQAGTYGPGYVTLTGFWQTVRVGAAVATLPAVNHYQMRVGIAPVDPVSGGSTYQKQHTATAADLFSMADAPAVVNTRPRFEISTTLGTPVVMPDLEWCFYLEFRGGEQQDDANNCQMVAADYYGGRGPSAGAFCGYTTGPVSGRTVAFTATDFRPRVGPIIAEAVLTTTGNHANSYLASGSAAEEYRGLQASYANWSTATNGTLFFDIRAGNNYGSNGNALVFLNMGTSWFGGAIPTPWGNLKLNPLDPGFDALTSFVLTLTAGGIHNGAGSPIVVPTLGASAVGQMLKTQAIVFNAGFTSPVLTTTSSILVY